MIHFHRRQRLLSAGSELSILRFFIAIGLACIDTIWVLYLYNFGISESNIGFITSGLVILSLFFTFISTPILEYFKENKILALSIIGSAICYLLIGTYETLPIFLIFASLLSFLSVLRMGSFSIIFRDSISDDSLNKEMGLLYAMLNLGWVVGPLIAGFFILKYGLPSVFIVAASCFFLSFAILLVSKIDCICKKRDHFDFNLLKNLKDFSTDKKMFLPYVMAAGLEVWWALIYIYVPLFIVNSGLSESSVALFLSLIIIPLVPLEKLVGNLSFKFGFEKFFSFGFLGLAIISFVIFFTNNIIVQLVLLGVAGIFASCIEPIQETFFFKRVKNVDEEKFYPIFTTSGSVGSFIGRIAIAVGLLFFPDKSAYLVIAVLMLIFTFFALKVPKLDH